jgi:hypothetical protein
MAGHFECIGFDDIIVAIEQAVRTGQRRERADGVSFVWRDESEASVVVHTVEDSVVDAFPTFATDLRLRAHPRGIASGAHELDGALHVELRDERGEIIYPFAIQLEDVDRVGALLPVSEPTEVRVSGFAERIEAWRDAESF